MKTEIAPPLLQHNWHCTSRLSGGGGPGKGPPGKGQQADWWSPGWGQESAPDPDAWGGAAPADYGGTYTGRTRWSDYETSQQAWDSWRCTCGLSSPEDGRQCACGPVSPQPGASTGPQPSVSTWLQPAPPEQGPPTHQARGKWREDWENKNDADPQPPENGKRGTCGPLLPEAGKRCAGGPLLPEGEKRSAGGPLLPEGGKQCTVGPLPPEDGSRCACGPLLPEDRKGPPQACCGAGTGTLRGNPQGTEVLPVVPTVLSGGARAATQPHTKRTAPPHTRPYNKEVASPKLCFKVLVPDGARSLGRQGSDGATTPLQSSRNRTASSLTPLLLTKEIAPQASSSPRLLCQMAPRLRHQEGTTIMLEMSSDPLGLPSWALTC